MRLPELGKITDAEYKLLSPDDLMMYNKTFPTMDYGAQPEFVEFPKMKYRLVEGDDGSKKIQSVTVRDAKEEKALRGDWRDGPGAFGIETAPSAPALAVREAFSFPVPSKDAADVPATSEEGAA